MMNPKKVGFIGSRYSTLEALKVLDFAFKLHPTCSRNNLSFWGSLLWFLHTIP